MKNKCIASVLAALISFSVISFSSAQAGRLMTGDVNNDGRIDGIDASTILTAYAKSSVEGGSLNLTEDQILAADSNQNGVIDAVDASLVLTYFAKSSSGYSGTFDQFVINNSMPLDCYPSGLESEEDALSLLRAHWELLPKGNAIIPQSPNIGFNIMSPDPKIRIEDSIHGFVADAGVKLFDYYAVSRGNYDFLRLTAPIHAAYPMRSEQLDTSIDLHFTICNIDGAYRIALKPLGNGKDEMESILGNYKTDNDYWVFTRSSNETYHVIDENEMMSLREKDRVFYAFRWLDTGSSVYLQAVNAEINWQKNEDGTGFDRMFFSYADNGHALTAVKYDILGAEHLAHSGVYRPGFVKVAVDNQGYVTEIIEGEPCSDDYYYPF